MTDRQKMYALRKWIEKQDFFLEAQRHNNLGTNENEARYYFADDNFFQFDFKGNEFGVTSQDIKMNIREDNFSDMPLDTLIKKFKKLVVIKTPEEIKAEKERIKQEKLNKIKELQEEITNLENANS